MAERGLHRGTVPPIECEILTLTLWALHEKITPNIGGPPLCAPPLVELRTPVRSKCEISTDFLTFVTQSVLLTDLAAQCAMPLGSESADRGPSQSGANSERQIKLSTSKNLSILTSLPINEINIGIV